MVAAAPSGKLDRVQLVSFFEENLGQFPANVLFSARTGDGVLLLEKNGHTVAAGSAAVRYRLVGARTEAQVEGLDALPARGHYYLGNDPSRWRTGVPLYQRTQYRDAYPGVDILYYRGAGGELEHDFIVAPGADPAQIRFRIEDADSLTLSPEGDLVAASGAGPIVYRQPAAYQVAEEGRRSVPAAYRLREGEVTFDLGDYDASRPLFIDPVVSLPVIIGGRNEDAGFDIRLDADNNSYITGVTRSPDFPTQAGAPAPTLRGGYDTFVTKLGPDLRTILWTAFLGGAADDIALRIELDARGAPIIAGRTNSADLPTRAALQSTRRGNLDGFIAKFTTGGSLEFSTYFGGTANDLINGLGVDAAGNILVAGGTNSADFPTTAGAVQRTMRGPADCFISRLNAAATQVITSTFFGGDQVESCTVLTLNSAGDILVAGLTALASAGAANNLPVTATAFQRTYGGGAQDGFVARFNSALTQLLYSTYIGGSGDVDEPSYLFVDPGGNAWTGGRTNSPNFPLTSNATSRTFRPPFTAWITRLATGATSGPKVPQPFRSAASDSPRRNGFPNVDFSSYRPGKQIQDAKFFFFWGIPFYVEIITIEEADGSARTQLHIYEVDVWGIPFGAPVIIDDEAIIDAIACSKDCYDSHGPGDDDAPGARAASAASPPRDAEFSSTELGACFLVTVARTFRNPNDLSVNDGEVRGQVGGIPPNKPRLIVKKEGPKKTCFGVPFFYEIVITNVGTVAADDVRFEDVIPTGLNIVGTSQTRPTQTPTGYQRGAPANCTQTGAKLECQLGTIPPSGQRRVYILVNPTASDQTFINTVQVTTHNQPSAEARTTVENAADVHVTKTGPSSAGAGAVVTYTITVGNRGPRTATDVVLTDTFPVGTRDTTFETTKGTCTGNTCRLASLPVGETWEIRVLVRLPVTPGVHKNKVSVAAKECDPNRANNTSVKQTRTVRGFADIIGTIQQLSLDKSGSQPKATMSAAALNAGPNGVAIAQLVLDLPPFTTGRVLPPMDVNCSPIGMTNDFLCNLGALARGARKEVRFEVTSRPGVDYYMEARAGAELPDPDLDNNRSQAVVEVTAPAPSQSVTGVSNSAKISVNTLSPGSDPAVFGSGFAAGLVVAPAGAFLPAELGGVQVRLNGIPAPLFFVAPGQANFQVPWELLGENEALLRVLVDGRESYAQQMRIVEFDPGIFTANQSGSGQGSILIAGTASLAAPEGFVPGSRPVKRGEFLSIFCNGLGQVNDPPPTGAVTPSDILRRTLEQPTVTIGGVEARVVFSGLAPGFIGFYQVNVEVPAAAPTGNAVPLVLTIGEEPSNEVTVAVAPAE
jgi:uncharacterized protein (TIGR03437 family)